MLAKLKIILKLISQRRSKESNQIQIKRMKILNKLKIKTLNNPKIQTNKKKPQFSTKTKLCV